MPTLVAESIAPTKRAFMSISCESAFLGQPMKNSDVKAPSATGTSTPTEAIAVAAAPLFFNSLKSVSSPLENSMNTTPICEKLCRTFISMSVGAISPLNEPRCKCPAIAGPIKSPAIIIPTTCGKPIFLVNIPNSLVASSIIATSNNMFITLNSIVLRRPFSFVRLILYYLFITKSRKEERGREEYTL